MDLKEAAIVVGLVLLAAYKLHQAVGTIRGARAEEEEKEETSEKRVAVK